jgi:hypothetical protein
MKQLKKIWILVPFFIFSCARSPYIKNYEPIKVFLESSKMDKNKFYILQRDKISNIEPLRIFNGDIGPNHTLPIEKAHELFNSKHWKKLYKTYAHDTVKKYWRKEDFPEYNFALENSKLLFSSAYYDKYPNGFGHDELIFLSEPLYYWKKKYIIFSYHKGYLYGGSSTQLVIMKKEKNKWVFFGVLRDYIF